MPWWKPETRTDEQIIADEVGLIEAEGNHVEAALEVQDERVVGIIVGCELCDEDGYNECQGHPLSEFVYDANGNSY